MIEFVYPHTQLVAGVDEVGRGPLVGAVVTAAVILDPARPIAGLNDSKKLSEKRRLALCEEIKEKALSWSLGRAEPHEIDELNIFHATMLAMQRAASSIGSPRPNCESLVDRKIAWPPSLATPDSNDTRVRVEFFSKIIASTLLLKGSGAVPWRNMALSSMARAIICCSSALFISLRVRKCLGAFGETIIVALSFIARALLRAPIYY